MKETTRVTYARVYVYSPVPENGNGEIKIKREYVRNGPFRSSPVQFPFATRFFKRAPVVRIERGTFFDAYRKFKPEVKIQSKNAIAMIHMMDNMCGMYKLCVLFGTQELKVEYHTSVSSRCFCKRGHNGLFKILGEVPCSVGV